MSGRILVIDDSPELGGFFSTVLAPLGYEVSLARDGEEGLAKFRDELPDLVFLDLVLPRKQGAEVVSEIKASDHGLVTPVVLMSGEARGVSRVELMRSFGVVDFLPKPIPVAKITHLAEWILAGRSDEEIVPAQDPELERIELTPGAEGVVPLAEAGLLLALRLAGEERLTGTVVAARGRHRRALVLEDGRIVGARSNAPGDRVDRILVSMRRATPGQMAAVRERLLAPGADPFAVLREAGVIDDAARETVLRYQAMSVALALFRWHEGSLRLLESEVMPTDRLAEPIPTARLLLLGLRKSREARQRAAQPLLADETTVLRPVSEEVRALAASALTRREREMFELMDGRRTVADLRALGRLAQLNVDDLLAVITGAGMVEPAPASAALPAAPAREFVPRATGEHVVGELRDRPLVEVVGLLLRTGATGILTVEGAARRQFAFERGEVVFARSSDATDRLGQVLLAEGRITIDVLERVLAYQREHRPDLRLGALLVEQGSLSIAALERAVRVQVLRILESAFGATEGAYLFEVGERGLGASVRLGLGDLDLLRLGVNRVDLPYLRRRWLGGDNESFVQASEGSSAGIALAAHESTLLELAALEPSVEDLVAAEGRDAVVLRALELLVSLGLVRVGRRPRKRAPVTVSAAELRVEPVAAALSETQPVLLAPEPAELPIVVLEPDSPGGPVGAADAGAVTRILDFLRDELVMRREAAEREARALAEEVGRLKEQVRQLEAELARVKAAPPPAASRARSRRRKTEPEPEPAAV